MLDRLIAASPYAGLYVALCLGGVGFPIPEEVPVLTAGVLAHRGVVRWWLALLVCIAGVVTGDLVLYVTGRRWGERVLDLRLVRRFLNVERRNALEASYRRYGMLIVFAARHVVGLRAAAFVTAGVVRLPFWKFAVADGVAIAYGIPLNFAIAYFFSAHLHAILARSAPRRELDRARPPGGGAGWLSVVLWRRSHRLLSRYDGAGAGVTPRIDAIFASAISRRAEAGPVAYPGGGPSGGAAALPPISINAT